MIYFSNKFHKTIPNWVWSFFILLGFALPVMAAWTQEQKITSTPRGVGAQHGNAVAISGNTMVVGARFDSTTASQAGAAYVYILNAGVWTQQAVLLANDGAATDKFGYSVAISEDTIVVGAYQDDVAFSDGGSAYVFVRNGTAWTQQQKLTASDGAASDEFGNSVGINGEVIVVGSHFANLPSGGADAGSAYIFRRTGTVWTNTQKLIPVAGPNGPILGDLFGESVAVSGGRIAVGAAGDDTPETRAGAVYVFAESGGSYALQQKLTILGGTNGDNFGGSVAIEGNTLVGGAREDTPVIGHTSRGSAYVFEFTGATWQSQGKLTASDGAAFDRFGWSVAVSGGLIAVGAREDDTAAGPDAGSAYIFRRIGSGSWAEIQKLGPADPFNGDRFGSAVALKFGNLVVGAAEKALSAPNGQGAAYYYVLEPACESITFSPALNLGVGTEPYQVAIGDFNLDGKPDLVTSNWGSNNISVLLGSGTGSFSPAVNYGVGIAPYTVAVGDFNRDGKPDVATANYGANNVSVLLGDGLGSFGAATNFSVGGGALSIVVGDFNLDGNPDLAMTRNGADSLSVLLGNGTGGFGPVASFSVGLNPYSVTIGDFNLDGKPDLAAANYSGDNVSLLLGDGAGGFGTATKFNVGDGPLSIATGDFNLDDKPDLAADNSNGASFSVLLGNGAGSFGMASSFFGGGNPVFVAVGDFNLDAKPDVATANNGSGNVSVLLGNGAGGFGAAANFSVGVDPISVAIADFNLDGLPDLTTANRGPNTVSVRLSTCGQSPPTNTPTDTPTNTPTSTDTPTSTPTSSGTPSISGTITYGNAVGSPATRFVPNVAVNGAGAPPVSDVTGSLGTYSLNGFGAGSYTVTPSKTGGANGITSFDAARVAQHASSINTLTGNQLAVADVSGNGSVSSFDAGQIARYVSSAPPFGSTGTWRFTPISRNYSSVAGSIVGEDYSALLMGEVSGNWTPGAARGVNSEQPTANSEGNRQMKEIAVELPAVTSACDKEVIVSVSVRGAAENSVIAYEFDLRYDPSVIQPAAEPVDVAGTVSRGLLVVTNALEPGLLRVVVYGAMAIEEDGLLLNLRFVSVGAAGSGSALAFERIMFNEGEPSVRRTDGRVEVVSTGN